MRELEERELTELRRKGTWMLVAAGWLSSLVLAIAFPWNATGDWRALAISVAVNLLPTFCAMKRRSDLAAMLVMALMAAAQPAILLYDMRGADWQLDMHMYFFVALAMLSVLCDWRPIVLASGLIAVHHLVLAFVAPDWVFSNGGGIGRVLLHAVAVVLQAGALIYIAQSLLALFGRLGNAREAREELARSELAAREAEAEREQKELAKQEESARQKAELLRLAESFEQSVATVAATVSTAAANLNTAAESLDGVAQDTGRQATELASTSSQISDATRNLASSVADLSQSISHIADNVTQQTGLTGHAGARALAGDEALRLLSEQSTDIGYFTNTIADIAAQTNMLALNATIEAARAGAAGNGFSVVAQEINDLAKRAGNATDEIENLLGRVQDGTANASDSFAQATRAIGDLTNAASAIQKAVEEQRSTASGIEMSADETALGVDEISQRIGAVARSAGTAEKLSGEVRLAAGALLGQAEELQNATHSFVRHLRAG